MDIQFGVDTEFYKLNLLDYQLELNKKLFLYLSNLKDTDLKTVIFKDNDNKKNILINDVLPNTLDNIKNRIVKIKDSKEFCCGTHI